VAAATHTRMLVEKFGHALLAYPSPRLVSFAWPQFKGLQVLGGLRQPSRSRPSRGGEPGERSHDDRDRPVITRRLTGMEGLRCRWAAMLQMLVLIWTHR
jgi:hypothetical protein